MNWEPAQVRVSEVAELKTHMRKLWASGAAPDTEPDVDRHDLANEMTNMEVYRES